MDGEASPEVKTITLNDRDLLLLCSDGLTNMVTDDEIVAILENKYDLNYVSRSLINAANAAGGNDNITVILVKVQMLV
jgi:protein phosphatase